MRNNLSFVEAFRYLQGGLSDALKSLDRPEQDSDLKNYEEILKSNRRNLLQTRFIDGKKRADTQLQVLYVTTDDRALAEDIRNATKDEIFRKIAEKETRSLCQADLGFSNHSLAK